jgi:putative Mg2+ transporter-C (MgtC) family protein
MYENIELFNTGILIPWEARQLFLAAMIGLVIGLEREWRGKAASLRTFSIIATGSCLFTILSVQAANLDQTRIAAQIVSGIGFLGGGVIFKTKDRIEGVTTGALIWLAAAIGMACGFNQNRTLFWACAVSVVAVTIIYTVYRIIHALRAHFGYEEEEETAF